MLIEAMTGRIQAEGALVGELRLCIWMNHPSPYQDDFFAVLNRHPRLDLRVVYFGESPSERRAEGWVRTKGERGFEQIAPIGGKAEELLGLVDDAERRVHIISPSFNPDLVRLLVGKGILWWWWSERPGIRVSSLVGHWVSGFKLIEPLFLRWKKFSYSTLMGSAFAGAFVQGELAARSFERMGVPRDRQAHLYYSCRGLVTADPNQAVEAFRGSRRAFLAVGLLCSRKGTDTLLRAYADVGSEATCLVLCGKDGSDGRMERLAARLGLHDRVLFLGAVPSDQLAGVYSACDVAVLASRFDGWGVVLNEAASLGLALIGSDQSGASWHLIVEGVTGARFRAGSWRSLAEVMRRYVDNPQMASTQGARARELFERDFTPEANVTRLLAALGVEA